MYENKKEEPTPAVARTDSIDEIMENETNEPIIREDNGIYLFLIH